MKKLITYSLMGLMLNGFAWSWKNVSGKTRAQINEIVPDETINQSSQLSPAEQREIDMILEGLGNPIPINQSDENNLSQENLSQEDEEDWEDIEDEDEEAENNQIETMVATSPNLSNAQKNIFLRLWSSPIGKIMIISAAAAGTYALFSYFGYGPDIQSVAQLVKDLPGNILEKIKTLTSENSALNEVKESLAKYMPSVPSLSSLGQTISGAGSKAFQYMPSVPSLSSLGQTISGAGSKALEYMPSVPSLSSLGQTISGAGSKAFQYMPSMPSLSSLGQTISGAGAKALSLAQNPFVQGLTGSALSKKLWRPSSQ